MVAQAMRYRGVAGVVAYEPGGDARLVSRDRRSTYLLATYRNDPAGATPVIEQRLARIPWVTVGGGAVAANQVGDQVSLDIARAELIAFPILFLLSLLVFRSAVSALLPLAVGGATILLVLPGDPDRQRHVNPMSIYALNLINGLGLGLAIDYSLFMVSRFREELAAAKGREEALAVTLRTAGHVGGVQRGDGRVRAGGADRLPAAVPVLDGHRRRAVRADRGGGVADAAAGVARRARRAGQRGRAAALEGGDRARGGG